VDVVQRQLRPSDLPVAYRFINTQSATRLANGDTINCPAAAMERARLVEVTPDKKVVWVLNN
jgi:hypothetical protein